MQKLILKYICKILTFLGGFYFYVFMCFGSFEIVEVMPNTLDDKNLEYITVQNTGDQPQSLSGFTLSDKNKDYLIESEVVIQPGNTQIFTRPETKLILNNSNEEIYLHDIDQVLVDEVSYATSTKGEAIFFELDVVEIIIPERLISQEVLISDEIVINTGGSAKDSVNLETNDDKEIINERILPEIILGFQSPSYVTQSGSTNTYVCDTDRDECRVNFDLRDTFNDNFLEKDYECDINFGLGDTTDQKGRCNPNTVTFPEGEFEVIFKIWHEDDDTIFSQKSIFVIHNHANLDEDIISFIDEEISSQGDAQEYMPVPDVIIGLQQPSYISSSGTGNLYVCDTSREECRVNFDLRDSFGEDISESDYMCQIDFGFENEQEQENTCNPNTITIPEGNHDIIFRITHENDQSVFVEKIITIENAGFISGGSPRSSSSSSSGSKVTISIPRLSLVSPELIIQSGLDREGSDYFCVKDICKINLKYEPRHSDEECYWNFGVGTYSHYTTQHKCNPSYVTFPEGEHSISLKVYDRNYEDNYVILPFTIAPKIEVASEEVSDIIFQGERIDNIASEEANISIELQGKMSQEKTLSGSSLICSGVERCYVNLQGLYQGIPDQKYSWELNGEDFSEKLNPNGIWVEGEGMHEIIFIAGEMQEVFQVYIMPLSLVTKESLGETHIKDQDIQEDTKNKLDFTQNFLVLKYDGLRISGKAPVGSRIEIYLKGEKILEGLADEKGKYRIVSKNFSVGEYIFDTKIISEKGEEIFLEKSGEMIITGQDRSFWFIVKTTKTSSSSTSSYTPKTPQLLLNAVIPETILEREGLGWRQKIFGIFLIFIVAVMMILHMLSKSISIISVPSIYLSLERFSVKQKIILILP